MKFEALPALFSLHVGSIRVEPRRITARYTVTRNDKTTISADLIYRYQEPVFQPRTAESINLASVILAQVAMNYGLFFDEIIFDGLYDPADQRFIREMTENTSREIYVNKLLQPNQFLLPPYNQVETVRRKTYTLAQIRFENTGFTKITQSRPFLPAEPQNFLILSSGGKDSLLSYGIIRHLGYKASPVFVNESGRHWFTALNAYRYLGQNEPLTARVWSNCDRMFSWMLRQMPFIRPDFGRLRSDYYPLRLWTVAVFLFGVLPLALKRGSSHILVGDEYDTTVRSRFRDISHYNGLFDQSLFFDRRLTRYYREKSWSIQQYSILRSLSELLIMKILVRQFPDLQATQISCHAAHNRSGRIYPCGACEKCRRIVGMLTALREDAGRCGYSPGQIQTCLTALETKSVKQIGPDAGHLYHLLVSAGHIKRTEHTLSMARRHEEIVHLRFDRQRAFEDDIPELLRRPLIDLLGKWTEEN